MAIPRVFRVFELEEKRLTAPGRGEAKLTRIPGVAPFESYQGAVNWIEKHGCAPAEYVVLESFAPCGLGFAPRAGLESAAASGALGSVGALWSE